MKRIFPIINAVIATSTGLIVLLGYFFSTNPVLQGFRLILLQWAVIVAGVAVLVGFGNLVSVHLQKIRIRKPGSMYSVVLLFFLLLSLLFSIAPEFKDFKKLFFDGILVPVEVSLMAVLAVTLIYASIRLLRQRANLTTTIFMATTFTTLLLFLLGQVPFISEVVRPFFTNVLASGGARGLLIGIALGALTTGLRILLGTDRPYGGK